MGILNSLKSIFGSSDNAEKAEKKVEKAPTGEVKDVFFPRLQISINDGSQEVGDDNPDKEKLEAAAKLRSILYANKLSKIGIQKEIDLVNLQYQAEHGDAESQYWLGRLYAQGTLVEANAEEAFRLYQQAAEQGHKEAELSMAHCYYAGMGCEKDGAKAFEIYEKHDDKCSLAMCYQNGIGTDVDGEKAFQCYDSAAAASNDPVAITELILSFSTHDDLTTKRCLNALFAEVSNLNADTETILAAAEAYRLGVIGGAPDWQASGFCYIVAAARGDKDALEIIDNINADGVEQVLMQRAQFCLNRKDAKQALDCINLAVERGFASGKFFLGCLHEAGIGVEQDDEKAVGLYQEAYEAGDADATCALAICYANGKCVERDIDEAARLFVIAADKGVVVAQYNLGNLYLHGTSVEKSYDKACELISKAAEAGMPAAMMSMGILKLEDGHRDIDTARQWLDKAVQGGVEDAKNILDLLDTGGEVSCVDGNLRIL